MKKEDDKTVSIRYSIERTEMVPMPSDTLYDYILDTKDNMNRLGKRIITDSLTQALSIMIRSFDNKESAEVLKIAINNLQEDFADAECKIISKKKTAEEVADFIDKNKKT